MLFDHLYFIWLIALCHQLDRLILRQCKILQLIAFFDDLLHLFFNRI